jgi:anhydro-N-acetylmuramic acid kinase
VEHIAWQITNSVSGSATGASVQGGKLLATGGGALNGFLMGRLGEMLEEHGVEVIVPGKQLVNFKEALIMAFIGVLRWRQEYNVLSSVTGAARNSIGGALWTGQEA